MPSIGQTGPEPVRVKDVFVLVHGASFVNLTDSTYFAIPRYRFQKLVRDAELGDSLSVMWQREAMQFAETIAGKENAIAFWRTTAIVSGAVAILQLIVSAVR